MFLVFFFLFIVFFFITLAVSLSGTPADLLKRVLERLEELKWPATHVSLEDYLCADRHAAIMRLAVSEIVCTICN